MTKGEFIAGYCKRSNIAWDVLKEKMVALPCNCGDESCNGWAMVENSEASIKGHMELYGADDLQSDLREIIE